MARQPLDHENLVTDLVEWVAKSPRSYSEVMDAWRTSCPRLAVWEDAVDHGFVERCYSPERGATVNVTPSGWVLLRHHGRRSAIRQ